MKGYKNLVADIAGVPARKLLVVGVLAVLLASPIALLALTHATCRKVKEKFRNV